MQVPAGATVNLQSFPGIGSGFLRMYAQAQQGGGGAQVTWGGAVVPHSCPGWVRADDGQTQLTNNGGQDATVWIWL